jgi:hypothetical protein
MILRGPAVIQFGDQVIYSEGDIKVTPERKTFDMEVGMFGKVDEREDSFMYKVGFTPAGIASAAYFATLFPAAYRNPVVGSTIFGAIDTDLVIWTIAGKKITLKRAALTKMPDLTFAANKALYGECEFTAIGALDEGWDTDGHFAIVSADAFDDTSFDPTQLMTLVYAASYGPTAPWNAIHTEAGFVFSFDLKLSDVPSDAYGIADMTIAGLSVSAKCIPHGVTEADLIAIMGVQGAGAGRGRSIFRAPQDLMLVAGELEPFITLKNAAVKVAPQQFGVEANRAGEIEFVATRNSFTAGVPNAVFDIGITPEAEA